MELYLKEPTMSEKDELIKMVNEFAAVNDEYPFEGLGNFKKIYEKSYEEFYDELEVNKIEITFNEDSDFEINEIYVLGK